jgi:hypothetical protein
VSRRNAAEIYATTFGCLFLLGAVSVQSPAHRLAGADDRRSRSPVFRRYQHLRLALLSQRQATAPLVEVGVRGSPVSARAFPTS